MGWIGGQEGGWREKKQAALRTALLLAPGFDSMNFDDCISSQAVLQILSTSVLHPSSACFLLGSVVMFFFFVVWLCVPRTTRIKME